jgi:hypothetical protein
MKSSRLFTLFLVLACSSMISICLCESESNTKTSHVFDSCVSRDCLDCQKHYAPENIPLSELSSRAFDLKWHVKGAALTGLVSKETEKKNQETWEHCSNVESMYMRSLDNKVRLEYVACLRSGIAFFKLQRNLDRESREEEKEEQLRREKKKDKKN